MKPDELRALADEIERGDGTDLQRDVKFERALWGSQTQDRRNFTTNLQDAVDAVPEGYTREAVTCPEMGSFVRIYKGPVREDSSGSPSGRSDTGNEAAATCATILRAKAAEMGGE